MHGTRVWNIRRLTLVSVALALGACDTITGTDDAALSPLAEVTTGGSGSPDGPVRADRCDGELGSVTVEEVEVPQDSRCVLTGTRVEGNVFVRSGAVLEAFGASVEGNIQAEDATGVHIADGTTVGGDVQVKRRALARVVDTEIDGNLQVEEGGADLDAARVRIGGDLQVKKAGGALVEDVMVRGNLQLEENADLLWVVTSHVIGNLQVVKNRGGVTLDDNRVAQSLQCDENEPAPQGSGNEAGEKEGQCSSL